jgi:hypothetical protein
VAEIWRKRQALCLAGQLPDNASDANAVIRELRHLVDTRLHPAVTNVMRRDLVCAIRVNRVSYKDASANQTQDCCDCFNHFINPMYGSVPQAANRGGFSYDHERDSRSQNDQCI